MGTTTAVRPSAPGGHALVERRADAAVRIRRLDWDSEFFGREMAIVEIAPAPRRAVREELREVLNAKGRAFDHLILRADAGDSDVIWAAESCGMRLVDVGIDSALALATLRRTSFEGAELVRPWVPEDAERLGDIAATAFVTSRFSADPFFSEAQVAAFHRKWIANLCDGLADAVLIYEGGDGPLGFVACGLQAGAGRIVLIATDALARRRGVGRALTLAALRHFAARGAVTVNVKTQAQNYGALALYARAGFTVSKAELTFSLAAEEQRV